MNLDHVQRMVAYTFWANRRVWDYVMKLDEDHYHQPSTYSIGSVHEQVVHTMEVEMLLLRRVSGAAPAPLHKPDAFPTREAVRARWDEIEAAWLAHLPSLTEADLERTVEYISVSRGTQFRNRVWELLFQWFNHSTDHRAQILALIHQLGGETGAQDFLFYSIDNPLP
jgi:uncharacterized damage-inducible protein DinB